MSDITPTVGEKMGRGDITPTRENAIAAHGAGGLLAMAIEKDLDIDKLERLVALKEREDAKGAARAFHDAMARFAEECPPIHKNRTTKKASGQGTGYGFNFADLPEIKRVVDPVLAKHGLSYRFQTTRTETGIRVACILSHVDGHSVESAFEGPIDSGSMNAIQKVGSGRSYAKRYALEDCLGISASDDDDGERSQQQSEPTITDAQALELESLITESGKPDEWQEAMARRMKAAYGVQRFVDLPAAKFGEILSKVTQAVKAKK